VAKLASPFLRSSFEKLADETADQLRGALAKLSAQP